MLQVESFKYKFFDTSIHLGYENVGTIGLGHMHINNVEMLSTINITVMIQVITTKMVYKCPYLPITSLQLDPLFGFHNPLC